MKKWILALLILAGAGIAHATTTYTQYGSTFTVVIASSVLEGTQGIQSAYIDNTVSTTSYVGATVMCNYNSLVAVGTGTLVIYAYGTNSPNAEQWFTDGVSGSSAAITIAPSTSNLKVLATCLTPSNVQYWCGPYDLSQAFPTLPPYWGIAILDYAGAITNGTCVYQGYYYKNQ